MRKFSFVLAAAALAIAMAVPTNAAEIKNNNTVEIVKDMGTYDLHELVNLDATADKGSSITVTNPNKPDSKAPVLKSIKFDKSSYTVGKDNYVKATIKATDDLSGIKYGQIHYVNAKSGLGFTVYFYESDYNKKKKVYDAEAYISSSLKTGTYNFAYAYVYDNADNEKYYSSTDKSVPSFLKKSSVKLVVPACKMVPTLKNITIEPDVINYVAGASYEDREKATITVDATSKVEDIDYIYVGLKMKASETSWRGTSVYVYKHYDYKTGKSYWAGDFSAYSDSYIGTWTVDYVTFYNSTGGFVEFNYDNKKLPTSYKKKTVTVKGKADSDKTLPKATAVSFVKKKVTMSKKTATTPIDIDVTVSDAGSGVKYVFIQLNDTKNGRAYSGSASLSTPIKKGKVRVTVNVPKNAASGTFKISYLDVQDAANNTVYYVTSSVKNKNYKKVKNYKAFPSAIAKVKLTLKNTYKKK